MLVAVVLRGVAAIIFGVLAFFWPGITLLTLVLFYGALMLVDGLFALGAAQSLAFGVALLALWFVADLVGVDPAISDTLLLLALVAVAARVLALLVTLGRAHLRH